MNSALETVLLPCQDSASRVLYKSLNMWMFWLAPPHCSVRLERFPTAGSGRCDRLDRSRAGITTTLAQLPPLAQKERCEKILSPRGQDLRGLWVRWRWGSYCVTEMRPSLRRIESTFPAASTLALSWGASKVGGDIIHQPCRAISTTFATGTPRVLCTASKSY